jgi:hypothetical protein
MRWSLFFLALILFAGCDGPAPTRYFNPPARVKVFTAGANLSHDCDSLLELVRTKQFTELKLVSDTLADFESEGSATIQVPRIPASKKLFVIVVVSDLDSQKTLSLGCAENIEVGKGAVFDLPILLNTPTRGDSE